MMKHLKRLLVQLLILSATLLCFANAQAALVTNQQIIHHTSLLDSQQTLLQTLQREEVRQQLARMDVSPDELENRVRHMTQEEIAQLNQKMDELPAGSGVLGTLLVLFIVFVITDVIGATDIFPFIHPVK